MTKFKKLSMNKIKKKDRKNSSKWREAWKRLRRNRTALFGMSVIIVLILIAIFADVIAPYDFQEQDYDEISQKPSRKHLFGTDSMGRDIFSRCIYGTRWSLPIALLCVIVGLIFGGSMGILAAYFGGKADNIIMRIVDILQAIPPTVLSIAIVSVLGDGLFQLVIGISIAYIPATAKVCRAAIFTVKENEYIDASRAIGASGCRIIFKHMVPNAVGPIIIFSVGMLASSILIVSTLSYIGIGIVPPTPEWGSILSAGKEYLRSAPHMVMFPGLMIALTVLSFNLFGDGLRDALDPRLK